MGRDWYWLKNRDARSFLIIWFAHLVSIIGTCLSGFGLGAWVVQQTHRTTEYSHIGLAATLPGALLSPFIGVLVDRWHRRTAMLLAEWSGCLASLALAVSALTGHLQLWQIYASTLVQTVAIGFTWPALSAVTTVLVPKRHLARASAMIGFTDAVGMLLGPSIGGLVLAAGGLAAILLADVGSFVVSILLLMFAARIPDIPPHPADVAAQRSMLQDIRFSWDYVAHRKGLMNLLFFFLVSNFLWAFAHTLLMPLLLTFYDTGRTGRIFGLEGVGVLAATIGVAILGAPRNRARGVVAFNGAASMMILVLSLPPFAVLYGISFFTATFFGTLGYTCSQSIWQSKVDPALQGRVFSIRRMMASLATPLSMLLAGPVADNLFTPALRPGGALAESFGRVFTVGPGAGLRALLCVLGCVAVVNTVAGLRNRPIQNIDVDLTDYEPKRLSEDVSLVEAPAGA